MSKRSYTVEYKMDVLTAYQSQEYSFSELCSTFNVVQNTVRDWIYKYEKYGIDGLKESKTWKRYPKELKLDAIHDYKSGQYSLEDVVKKYEISSDSVLLRWIRNYNGHRDIKATGKGLNRSMAKGRSTTWKERIDIVHYCISKDKDYHETAEHYGVSYQQVYQWVRKHEAGGIDALQDRRGRNKTEEELTPEEKIKFEMKRLERENERLKADNAFLKKLKEIERRRY